MPALNTKPKVLILCTGNFARSQMAEGFLKYKLSITAIIFYTVLIVSAPSRADEQKRLPLWQIGATAGAISVSQYVGSDQRYNVPVIFPSFIYRGDRLRARREGVRGLLFSSKNLSVDVGFAGGLPVYSSGNRARDGMPDIPFTGEIGPRLVVRLYGNGDGNRVNILARLPVRTVGRVDGKTAGWTFGPDIIVTNINHLPFGLNAYVSAGLKYGSEEYNNLFYGVDEEYSESWRTAYKANEGISWYSLLFSVGRRFNSRFSTRLYLEWFSLAGSVVADSPLVKKRNNLSVVLWFSWLPWESKNKESDIHRLPEPEEDIGM